MKTVLSKWGNSYAIRLPKLLVLESGMKLGKEVDLLLGEHGIMVKRPRATLQELVKAITPENRHKETHTGKGIGKEIW